MNLEDVLIKNKPLNNIHAGKRCFIIGNGPSINAQDITRLRNEIKITASSFFNHPDAKTVNPDYWILADPNFWLKPEVLFSPLIKVAMEKAITTKLFVPTGGFAYFSGINLGPLIDLHFFHYDRAKDIQSKIDLSSGVPPFGQNVIVVALMLAYHLGCNPIYFIGCDHDFMNVTQEEYENVKAEHFYIKQRPDKYSEHMGWNQWQAAMDRMNYEYYQLKHYAALWGFDVFNATPGGHFDTFPRVQYESLFVHLIDFLGKEEQQAYEAEAMTLARSAVKLMNEGAAGSALALLEASRRRNIHANEKTDGIEYLMALCLAKLGEYDRSMICAREDLARNPGNKEKTLVLIEQLGRYI